MDYFKSALPLAPKHKQGICLFSWSCMVHTSRVAALSLGGKAASTEAWKKTHSWKKKRKKKELILIFWWEACAAFRLPFYLLEGTASSGKHLPALAGNCCEDQHNSHALFETTRWLQEFSRGAPNNIRHQIRSHGKKQRLGKTRNSYCSQKQINKDTGYWSTSIFAGCTKNAMQGRWSPAIPKKRSLHYSNHPEKLTLPNASAHICFSEKTNSEENILSQSKPLRPPTSLNAFQHLH